MRKFLALVTLSFSFMLASAQDLLKKIPANTDAIATINTSKLFQLMTIEEWNATSFGKKLLELSSKNATDSLKSFNDIGLDLAGNIYYFHQENDSISYNYILGALANSANFARLFSNKPSLQLDANTTMVADDDSTSFYIWNKQQFLYAKGSLKDAYFYDYEVAKRHGLTLPYSMDTTAVPDTLYPPLSQQPIEDTTSVIIEEPAPEPPPPAKPAKPSVKKKSATAKSKTAKAKKPKKKEEDVPPPPPMEEVTEAPADYDTYKTDSTYMYNNTYDNDNRIKRSIAAACTRDDIKKKFTTNPDTSIFTNANFMKSIDPGAAATVWVNNPMGLYYSLLSSYYSYGMSMRNPFFNRFNNSMYKSFTSKLFFEEKQVRIATVSELTDEMVPVQQKMFSRKLNKKLIKYINTDSLLGYLSVSMDTKSYLESFPTILENTYGNMGMGLSSDEYGVISEFISFLIDEDAISKLVKGDGIVLFTGLYPQPVTYTDYVYDDNFNSTPVEKTRIDTLPRFLFMFSSEENSFERKLINYGIKKEVVKQRNGYYELNIPKSPMQLFFTNKDGIFFLTNTPADIEAITNGKYTAKISKQEKKLLLNHNYALYINPERIVDQFAKTEIGAAETLSSTMNTFKKMGVVRGLMFPVQGNTMSGELTMEANSDRGNSLKYFFSLFDGFAN